MGEGDNRLLFYATLLLYYLLGGIIIVWFRGLDSLPGYLLTVGAMLVASVVLARRRSR